MAKPHADKPCPICRFLAADVLPSRYVPVHRFRWSLAVLHPKQVYPGHCELWLRRHARELFDLSPAVRSGFFNEMNTLAQAVYLTQQPRKMNYELLGNVAPHLHWHVIPRYDGDPRPQSAIWSTPQYTRPSKRAATPRAERIRLAAEIATRIKKLQRAGCGVVK